jgi:hypothetical protein
MQCPKCQFDNRKGAKFCLKCGIEKIQKYLPKGLTEKSLSQKDRIEGERKQVMQGNSPKYIP